MKTTMFYREGKMILYVPIQQYDGWFLPNDFDIEDITGQGDVIEPPDLVDIQEYDIYNPKNIPLIENTEYVVQYIHFVDGVAAEILNVKTDESEKNINHRFPQGDLPF